jgi:hypothetical protein
MISEASMVTAGPRQTPLDVPGHLGPLALIAGAFAGLAGGVAWALLVRFTGYEIGYVAWGIGLFVGYAMARVTPARSRSLAVAAALISVFALFTGKALIFVGSTGLIAEEYASDEELMRGGIAWQMYGDRELAPSTVAEVEATFAAGDTLSDSVWEAMNEEAAAKLAGLTEEERAVVAAQLASAYVADVGVLAGVGMQLSAFDLLWLLLAVSTAFRMLSPGQALVETAEANG